MKKNIFKFAGAIFLTTLIELGLIAAVAISQPQKAPEKVSEKDKCGGTLKVGIYKDPKSLDSRYLGWGWEANQGFNHIYERLVEYGPTVSSPPVPALAESWEQLDDVTWLVRIRKGVKFHHGRELTAEDIRTQVDWSMKTPKGWRPVRQRSSVSMVKKVETVDKYTLKFTLEQPDELFLPYVLRWAHPGYSPPDLVEKWGREYSNHPTGTGPFKFAEWVSGDHITLERYDDYWGKKPYLDKVIFRALPDPQTRFIALQKGEVDIALIDLALLPTAQKDPNIKVCKIVSTIRQDGGGINFNLRRWPMNSLKFRQAVAMGADWEKIAKVSVPHGLADIQRSLLKGSWAYDPRAEKIVPRYNPEKAKMLIKEVEKEAGRPIPPLYALTRDDSTFANFLTIAENELKKIGVPLNLQILSYDVAKDKRQRDPKIEWDINLWGQSRGPGLSPIFFLDLFRSDRPGAPDGKNMPGYSNPRVDELIKLGRKGMKDRKKLRELYLEIEKILLTDIPYLPIWNQPMIYGVNKKVHDFYPHDSVWVYLDSSFNNVWIEK